MTEGIRRSIWPGGLLLVVCAGLWALPGSPRADDPVRPEAPLDAVEPDMHEFMEYAFQEPYKRLKSALAQAPADNAAWKGIKSDALILAEGGNLILLRGPDEKREAWRKHSIEVRSAGAELYRAGKAKDYPAAKAKWATLLMHCNACHDDFSEGDPQLKP